MASMRNTIQQGFFVSLQALSHLNKNYNPLIRKRGAAEIEFFEREDDMIPRSILVLVSLLCLVTVFVAWKWIIYRINLPNVSQENQVRDPSTDLHCSQDEDVLQKLRQLQSLLSNLPQSSCVSHSWKSCASKYLSSLYIPNWANYILDGILTKCTDDGNFSEENLKELEEVLWKTLQAIRRRCGPYSSGNVDSTDMVDNGTITDSESLSDQQARSCAQERRLTPIIHTTATSDVFMKGNNAIHSHEMAAPRIVKIGNDLRADQNRKTTEVVIIPSSRSCKVKPSRRSKSATHGKTLNIEIEFDRKAGL